jgi:hypothetical protein
MSTTTRRLQVGDKVRHVLGDTGTVIPVAEWPHKVPADWTDESMVIVRWDETPGRANLTQFTPWPRAEAEEYLSLVELEATVADGIAAVAAAKAPIIAELFGKTLAPQGEPADIAEDDGVHRASSQAGLASFVPAVAQPHRSCSVGTSEHPPHVFTTFDEEWRMVSCPGWTEEETEGDTPAVVQLDRDDAAAHLAADLRRLADLAESGLLDGHAWKLDFFVESPARVQAVVDQLGGTVHRYRASTDTVQAHAVGALVGSVKVVPIINTTHPWGDDADSDETWAALVQGGNVQPAPSAAEFQVGVRYMYDGMLVEATVIDGDRIEFRAVHDQEAIARGWFPTSYDTYEASMSIADFRSMVDGGAS